MSEERIDERMRRIAPQPEVHENENGAGQNSGDESPPTVRAKRDSQRQQPEHDQRHARIGQPNERQPANDPQSSRGRKRRYDLENPSEEKQTVRPSRGESGRRRRGHVESLGFHLIEACLRWRSIDERSVTGEHRSMRRRRAYESVRPATRGE